MLRRSVKRFPCFRDWHAFEKRREEECNAPNAYQSDEPNADKREGFPAEHAAVEENDGKLREYQRQDREQLCCKFGLRSEVSTSHMVSTCM